MSSQENSATVEISDSTIVFFCKDCKATVNAQRISPNKYAYKCPECNSIKVAFGTMRSIKGFICASKIKKVQIKITNAIDGERGLT